MRIRLSFGRKSPAAKAFYLVLAVLFMFQAGLAFGGTWSASWNKLGRSWDATKMNKGAVSKTDEPADIEPATAGASAVVGLSAAPKLFWADCGPDNNCANATLWYVDPAATKPARIQFMTGVFLDAGQPEMFSIPAGTVNVSTYQVSNLRIAYILYAKGGKMWAVDTTTLAKTQVSSETGVKPETMCGARTLVNWVTPEKSTVFYALAGPDGLCSTGDEAIKAVKLGMTSTTSPINLVSRDIQALLFDGTYLSFNWGSSPGKIEICQPNLASCSTIGQFNGFGQALEYDPTRVLMVVDGVMKVYDYSAKTMTTLYTISENENMNSSSLDRDGYVYFSVETTTAPYTDRINKVPVGGGSVTQLASFTTTAQLNDMDLTIGPSYVTYGYLNPTATGNKYYSVPKAGGTPVLLASSHVNGGTVGQYFVSEDSVGNVTRMNVDGTGKITKKNALIDGYTLGGSGDWHYGVDASTMKFFLSDLNSKLRAYGITDDFSSTSTGILIGTLPVNVNNFEAAGISSFLLGDAGRRHTDLSFGRDVLFMNSSAATSLTRLTNANGGKGILSRELSDSPSGQ